MWIVRDFSRINRQIYLQRETWRGRKFKAEIYCASVVRDIIWTVSFHLPLLHCKLPATQRWTTTLPRRIRSLSFATDHRRRLFRWKVNRVRKTSSSSSSSSTSKSARQTLPIPTPPPPTTITPCLQSESESFSQLLIEWTRQMCWFFTGSGGEWLWRVNPSSVLLLYLFSVNVMILQFINAQAGLKES